MKKLLTLTSIFVALFLQTFAQTAPVWSSASTGTIDGVSFTVTGGNGGTYTNDLSAGDYSAAPLSSSEQTMAHGGDAPLTITFSSPVTDVALYLAFWRGGGTYTFNQTPVKLGGNANFSVAGNTLTAGNFATYSSGIVSFPGTYSSLSFTVSGGNGNVVTTTLALVPQGPPALPKNASISEDPSFTADASAILDIHAMDNDKGLLVPRMTAAERDVITAPATGLLVYATDLFTFSYYDGQSWSDIYSTLTPPPFTGNAPTEKGNKSLQETVAEQQKMIDFLMKEIELLKLNKQ